MVRDQTRWMLDILEDHGATGVVVVTTPEEMPVTETIDLLGRLDAETRRGAAAVVANRVLPALFDRRQSEVVDRLGDAERRCSSRRAGTGVRQVVRRRPAHRGPPPRRRPPPRAPARRPAAPGLPVLYVPELFTRATGRRVVSLVAEALADELDVG